MARIERKRRTIGEEKEEICNVAMSLWREDEGARVR
jgi:hypothetical protein